MDSIIIDDCREYLDKIDLSPLYGRTVLITGANGLIGTYIVYILHLANAVKHAGINIVAISKNPPSQRLEEIFAASPAGCGSSCEYSGAVRNEFHSFNLADISASLPARKADYIIHGATYAQPAKFLKNYLDTIHLNTLATEKLLEKAKSDNAAFLFLSSSEIYGEPDETHIPTQEDYPGLCSPVCIRSIYSESKRMGETLCFAYRHFDSVDAKIARISMSYGPGTGLGDERVLSQFIRQALEKKKIEMIDDGSKVRTFCYIADCVAMLLNILLYGRNFVYNVGGADSVSIMELASLVCSMTGSSIADGLPADRLPPCAGSGPRQGDSGNAASKHDISVSPKQVRLDIKKVRKEFDLPPFMPFHEGLRRTIEWSRQNLFTKSRQYT